MFLQKLLKRHEWLNTYRTSLFQGTEGSYGQNTCPTIYYGTTGSGKSYMMKWDAEASVIEKKAKPIFLWCPDTDALEELCGFLFPNKLTAQNFGSYHKTNTVPRAFDVAIYIPVSDGITDPNKVKYPANPFERDDTRSGIVPFTIPITTIDFHTFQVLYGSMDSENAYREFRNAVINISKSHKKMSFADFRKIMAQERKNKMKIIKGFQGVEMPHLSAQTNEPTITALLSRINSLEHEGILSSANNPYALPKLLEKELLIKDRIVILYTGFIENQHLKFFVTTYFAMSIYKLMRTVRHQTNYKIKTYFDEVRDLFRSQKSKSFNEMSKSMLDVASFLTINGRKRKIEPHFSSQSNMFLDDETKSNFKMKYVFSFTNQKDIEWLAKEIDYKPDILNSAFQDWTRRQLHRFFISGGGYKSVLQQIWSSTGIKREFGFELPRPILSFDGAINLKLSSRKPNWKALQLPMDDNVLRALKSLRDEWTVREQMYKDKILNEKREAKTLPMKIMGDIKKDLLLNLVKLEGWNKSKLSTRLNITRATLDKYLNDLLIAGKITEEDLKKMEEEALQNKIESKVSKTYEFPNSLKELKSFTTQNVRDALNTFDVGNRLQTWLFEKKIKKLGRGIYAYNNEQSEKNKQEFLDYFKDDSKETNEKEENEN